jgi:tetratricopeptide (TPR) repeat protein
MKPLSLASLGAKRFFPVLGAVFGLLFASLVLPAGGGQRAEMQAKLSLFDVIYVLRTKTVRGEFVPLAKRNEILTQGVNERGVTFNLTPEIESELRAEGASDTLIAAIRQKSAKPVSTPTPAAPPAATPTPTPTPSPTPALTPTPDPQLIASNDKPATATISGDPKNGNPLSGAPPKPTGDPAAYKTRADEFRWKGDNDRAIEEYGAALALNPDYYEAYFGRAQAYFNKKDYERAIGDYDQAIKLRPQDAVAFYARGICHHYKGNFTRAAEDYRTAFQLKSDIFAKELIKCLLYETKTESPDSGIENCGRMIAVDPTGALFFYIRGIAHNGKGNFEQALKDFNKSAELYPEFVSVYRVRAAVHERLGRRDLAAADRQRTRELETNGTSRVPADGKPSETKQPEKPASAPKLDITGAWVVNLQLAPGQNLPVTINFQQEGERLTGNLQSGFFGAAAIRNGAIKSDGAFTFDATISVGGQNVDISVTGRVSGAQISGTATSPQGPAAFSGAKGT